MANIPGITISILRSQTFGQTGQPLQISGRVTAFSVPLPLSFVRVSLTGPDYDPQTTAFDTLADPEGNYAVGVVAPADGNYTVKADAYPFPLLPQGPLIAQPILLPSIGESDSPPLVFGAPGPGGVIASGPNGAANLGAPALTQPELNLNLAIGNQGGGSGGTVVFPGYPAQGGGLGGGGATPPSLPNPGSPIGTTPVSTPTTIAPPVTVSVPTSPTIPTPPTQVSKPTVTPAIPLATPGSATPAPVQVGAAVIPIGTAVITPQGTLGVVSAAPNNPTGSIYNFVEGPGYGIKLNGPPTTTTVPTSPALSLQQSEAALQQSIAATSSPVVVPTSPTAPTSPSSITSALSSQFGSAPAVPAAPTSPIPAPPRPSSPASTSPVAPKLPAAPTVTKPGVNTKSILSDVVTAISPAIGATLTATGVLPKAGSSVITKPSVTPAQTPVLPKVTVPTPGTISTPASGIVMYNV